MTTNPTPADLAQKPSERIAEMLRTGRFSNLSDVIVDYLDEQSASTQSLLARPCWSCGTHSREWFAANGQAPQAEETLPEARHVKLTLSCLNCGNNSTDFIQSVDSTRVEHYRAHHAKCEARPPEPKNADLDNSACYCSDYCLPGKCPNVPTAIAPPEPIIRAAEGVTLEPGEYTAGFALGAIRFTLTASLPAIPLGREWVFGFGEPIGLRTAVRRVAPVAEPEPVAESGGDEPVCSTCNDAHVMTLRRDGYEDRSVPCTRCPTPCPNCAQRSPGQARGAYCAETPCGCGCHEPPDKGCPKHGNINCTACREADRLTGVTRERDELRSRVSELEAQPSGKYFRMLQRAMMPRWKTCSAWADAIPQVEQLVASLATTEAKLAERYTELGNSRRWSVKLEEALERRDAEIARLREQLASANARVERWRESRDAAVAEVRTVISRDKSGLAAGLAHVMAIARRYEWIPENHWGSYETDAQCEAVLREETGNLIRGVVDGCMRYLRASGARADEAAKFTLEAPDITETPAVAAPAVARVVRRVRPEIEIQEEDPPAPPTAIPRGTTLEVGRWYRITAIAGFDNRPSHRFGAVLRCAQRCGGMTPDNTISNAPFPGVDGSYWFAAPSSGLGGTYVTGVELVPGPEVEEQT